jgi:hypothetical protein
MERKPIISAQVMYTGKKGRQSVVAYTMTDGGYFELKTDFPWESAQVSAMARKVHAAGSIDPQHWRHVTKRRMT